ncbi:MAG TPA: hypothetical protein VMU81_26890, partial [Acetobacteraceae bacterium]|nr:hypothetical protein [Acetobacteraceae bacterium]
MIGMPLTIHRIADKPGQGVRIACQTFDGGARLSNVRRLGGQPAPAGSDIENESRQKFPDLR